MKMNQPSSRFSPWLVRSVSVHVYYIRNWSLDVLVNHYFPAGELYRRNIVVALVGRSVANHAAAEVLRMHQFASQNFDANISVNTTLTILRALKEVMTLPFRVDVGLLVSKVTVRVGPRHRPPARCKHSHVFAGCTVH